MGCPSLIGQDLFSWSFRRYPTILMRSRLYWRPNLPTSTEQELGPDSPVIEGIPLSKKAPSEDRLGRELCERPAKKKSNAERSRGSHMKCCANKSCVICFQMTFKVGTRSRNGPMMG